MGSVLKGDADVRVRLGPEGAGGSPGPLVKRAVKVPSGGRAACARTGGKKFDELLNGGFPLKSKILVQGPSFIGKDLLLDQFVAEGIRSGAPAIIILTQATTSQVRKKIVEMDPKLEDHERLGLVSYVDCYTKTAGLVGKNPFAIYLNGVQELETIVDTIERFQRSYSEKYFYNRIVFDSLSSIIRMHGINATLDFLNNLNAKIVAYNSSALFDLSGGIHAPNEINAVESLMDGVVNLKEDRGKHLLSVKGLANIKSREWLEYSYNERYIDIKGIYSYSYIQ
jgi:KaiC/GvpD/RAD55 family RecA-like ATPase